MKKMLILTAVIALSSYSVMPALAENIEPVPAEKISAEYVATESGYKLDNFTFDTYDLLFKDSDFNLESRKLVDSVVVENEMVAASYEEIYSLRNTFIGPDHGAFYGTHHVRMEVNTRVVNSKEYVYFVRIIDISGLSLESGKYEVASGTGAPTGSIENSGATLRINQFIQFQTTTAISVSGGVSVGWASFGTSVGGNHYYRSDTKHYSFTKNLPFLSVIQ